MAGRLPALGPAELIRELEKAGFYTVRQTGSPLIMYTPGMPRPVPLPKHNRPLRRGIQEAIIRQAGLIPEEVSRLLQRSSSVQGALTCPR